MSEPTFAALVDPMATEERGAKMTPARALRAVGHYLDRERPVETPMVGATYPGQPARPWPGPWVTDDHGDSVRMWDEDRYAFNGTHVIGRPVGDAPGRFVTGVVRPTADEMRRAADAILATICDGPDPHAGSGYDVEPAPDADWSRVDLSEHRDAFAAAERDDRARRGGDDG